MTTRSTAWTNIHEYFHVYSLLYEQNEIRNAIEKINVWNSRCKIPFGVEITGILAHCHSYNHGDEFHERMILGMALIRFVNGFVDPLQRSYYATSIGNIAQQLGLPFRFVEIRHASTHEDLPSLLVLRQAVILALSWLKDNYWIPSLQVLDSVEISTKIINQIARYKALRKHFMTSNSSNSGENQEIPNYIDPIKHLTRKSLLSNSRSIQIIIDILLLPGNLVPKSKKKRGDTLSISLKELWIPLIESIHNVNSFTHELIMNMLRKEEELNENGIRSSTLSSYFTTLFAWIKYAIQEYERNTTNSEKPFDDIDINEIRKQCYLNPTILTRSVLSYLNEPLNPLLEHMDYILSIKNKENTLRKDETIIHEDNLNDSEILDTANYRLEMIKKVIQMETLTNKNQNKMIWSPVVKFHEKFIGVLHDGSLPNLEILQD